MKQDMTVFIIDDDEAVRDSLDVLLEAAGYSTLTFASGPAFLEACPSDASGCVLLDVRMPVMNGLDVLDRLRDTRPNLPVIMITGHGDVAMAVGAMKSGAVDFVEKPFHEEALLASVENALSTAEKQERQNAGTNAAIKQIETLTPRERDVFERLVMGRANKVIAYELGCSPRTVEVHRARIMEKMAARSLAHLVRMALAAGVNVDSD